MIFERNTHTTWLGVRLYDPVTERIVRNGLSVTAWRDQRPQRRIAAITTPSGVYAFHHLARQLDNGASPPDTLPFVIEIEDHQRRFIPITLDLNVPLAHGRLFPDPNPTPTSPPTDQPPGLLLASAPNRAATAAHAALHTQLIVANTDTPAEHAVLIATIGGREHFGIADENGSVTLIFPYPPFQTTLGASPPSGLAPSDQSWAVTLTVRYQPASVRVPLGSDYPEIGTLLDQAQRPIWQTQTAPLPASPPADFTTTLHWGEPLIVHTDNLPTLWIG